MIDRYIDFSFIRAKTEHLYCSGNGRLALDPVALFKMLTDWLVRRARQAQSSGSARTFVACDEDRVADYFSLTVGQIDTLEAPERIRRGMEQVPHTTGHFGQACR